MQCSFFSLRTHDFLKEALVQSTPLPSFSLPARLSFFLAGLVKHLRTLENSDKGFMLGQFSMRVNFSSLKRIKSGNFMVSEHESA
jgi:hypothetical protein